MRLEWKMEVQEYQLGEVASLATKRKALLTDYEQGNTVASLDVFNLLSDHILLSIAHVTLIWTPPLKNNPVT